MGQGESLDEGFSSVLPTNHHMAEGLSAVDDHTVIPKKKSKILNDKEKERRKKKKNSRQRKLKNVLPLTKGQLQTVPKKPFVFVQDQSFHFLAPSRETNARVFRGEIPNNLLSTLLDSTDELVLNQPPPKLHHTPRAEQKGTVYHCGIWRKYMKEPRWSAQSLEEPMQKWLDVNGKLFKAVSDVFKREYKELFSFYAALHDGDEDFPLYPWMMVNINYRWAVEEHRDTSDFQNGLCWVLVFGEFTGGELVLKEPNITIQLKPGDLVCFKSYSITHYVKPFQGQRNSLVFFTHHNMFFPYQEEQEQKIIPISSRRKKKT